MCTPPATPTTFGMNFRSASSMPIRRSCSGDVDDGAVGVEELAEDVADHVVLAQQREVIVAEIAKLHDRGVQRRRADADHCLLGLARVLEHLLDRRFLAQRRGQRGR